MQARRWRHGRWHRWWHRWRQRRRGRWPDGRIPRRRGPAGRSEDGRCRRGPPWRVHDHRPGEQVGPAAAVAAQQPPRQSHADEQHRIEETAEPQHHLARRRWSDPVGGAKCALPGAHPHRGPAAPADVQVRDRSEVERRLGDRSRQRGGHADVPGAEVGAAHPGGLDEDPADDQRADLSSNDDREVDQRRRCTPPDPRGRRQPRHRCGCGQRHRVVRTVRSLRSVPRSPAVAAPRNRGHVRASSTGTKSPVCSSWA